MTVASTFDELAPAYDATFSRSLLGTLLRRAVWRRMDALFQPGDRVLDLGCGTGEDALHLAERGIHVLATDASPGMVAELRRKAENGARGDRGNGTGGDGRIDAHRLRIEELSRLGDTGPFDGVLSNFGALNCVEDLPSVARELGARTRPGARVLLTLMGPAAPWEWAWYLLRGQPGKAFRRLRSEGAEWRGVRVRYPSIRATRRAFAPAFRVRRVAALGALLPPTYAEEWARRHPALVRRLDTWERRLETVPPLPWLADHYLLEMVRE